jgi:hypothetical protein
MRAIGRWRFSAVRHFSGPADSPDAAY